MMTNSDCGGIRSIFIKSSLVIFVLITLAFFNGPTQAADCGAVNQNTCKILERLTACDKGLVPSKGKCVNCGGKNERLCPVNIQIRSCDKGLMASRGKCVDCGALNQKECPVTVQLPSCDKGYMAFKGRCIHCGGIGQRECPITVQVPSCDTSSYDPITKAPTGGLAAKAGKCQPCGGVGEMECPVTVQVPSCDTNSFDPMTSASLGGLAAKGGTCHHCGDVGEMECPITVQMPSCDKDLNAYAGQCIQRQADIIESAKQAAKGFADTLTPAALAVAQATEVTALILSNNRRSDVLQRQKVIEFAQRPDVKALMLLARENGYGTVSFGVAMSAAGVFGADTEFGYAFSTDAEAMQFTLNPFESKFPPTEYLTGGYSGGFQFGASGAIIVGFYRAGNQPSNGFGGASHGATVSIAAFQGSGASVWFNYDGTLAGISYAGTAGAKFSAGAYNRVSTTVRHLQ